MENENFDFYRRAAIVCRAIPCGKAATYGQIALLCGKPKNARQVGYALSRGRLGDGIPAHRVVNSRGVLSGAAAPPKLYCENGLHRWVDVKVSRKIKLLR